MQKNYELLYIVHPDLEGSTDKVTEKVAGFIKKAEGEIISQEDWGKRKLAYTVAKNDFGVYVLVNFNVESTKLHLLERDLRLSEEILRSMIVVVPDVKEIVLKPRKEASTVEVAPDSKVEEPANIIEKPKAKTKKVVEKVEEKVEEKTNIIEKKAPAKKATVKKPAPKKVTKTGEASEAERLKKLDEKLDELLK